MKILKKGKTTAKIHGLPPPSNTTNAREMLRLWRTNDSWLTRCEPTEANPSEWGEGLALIAQFVAIEIGARSIARCHHEVLDEIALAFEFALEPFYDSDCDDDSNGGSDEPTPVVPPTPGDEINELERRFLLTPNDSVN